MNTRLASYGKRLLSGGLSGLLLLGTLPAALAAELPPACDETYYATLDYYGALTESSVVKSYRTRGSAVLTDFGDYTQVTNLTDGRSAVVKDGTVTFDLTGDVPERFYFEGKTEQPYADFPWTLSLRYTLNGVPTPAEELAGRSGVVEILVDAVPNPRASAYSRNNLALTAMSLFNGDDLLSLEAPGAQVQLLGNLYCVLYAALPGEEQHFSIRVGSEDFTYSGMVFLAVPATLEQLDQVADLRSAKEEAEDSYRAAKDSMDAMLDAMEGMSGSLSAAAGGLDQLNQARAAVSGGKEQVYADADAALEAAGALTASLRPFTGAQEPEADPESGHLDTARQALSETRTLLNAMSGNAAALGPKVEEARQLLTAIQGDLKELDKRLDEAWDSAGDAGEIARRLAGNLKRLKDSLGELSDALGGTARISTVPGVTVNGMTVAEIKAAAAKAQEAHDQYLQAQAAGFPGSFPEFLVALGGQDEATAAKLDALYRQSQAPGFSDQLNQADTANGLIGDVNDKIGEINDFVDRLSQPAGQLAGDLVPVTDSLTQLAELLADVTDDEGRADLTALEDLEEAAALAIRTSSHVDEALDHIEALTGILNTYEPSLQQTLADTGTGLSAAIGSLDALTGAARSAEDLLRTAGPDLDSGTQRTLAGVSAALRKSSAGLDQTSTVRAALDTIDTLIDDQWTSHTGGDNNLLLTDAGAPPESITDGRNTGTASIQYVMRTREITGTDEVRAEEETQKNGDKGTLWSRIKAMFQDIWAAITGIFHV